MKPRFETPFKIPYHGEGNGSPLQYSCLKNPIDRGAWQATVHGVARVGRDSGTKKKKKIPYQPVQLKECTGFFASSFLPVIKNCSLWFITWAAGHTPVGLCRNPALFLALLESLMLLYLWVNFFPSAMLAPMGQKAGVFSTKDTAEMKLGCALQSLPECTVLASIYLVGLWLPQLTY